MDGSGLAGSDNVPDGGDDGTAPDCSGGKDCPRGVTSHKWEPEGVGWEASSESGTA